MLVWCETPLQNFNTPEIIFLYAIARVGMKFGLNFLSCNENGKKILINFFNYSMTTVDTSAPL